MMTEIQGCDKLQPVCTLAPAKEPISFVLGAVQTPGFLCTLKNMRSNSGASEKLVKLKKNLPPVA